MKLIKVIVIFIMIGILGTMLYSYKDDIRNLFFKEYSINENDNSTTNKELDKYKEISNFKLDNLNRYMAYKNKNNNLSYEDVVTYVNIGLDYNFYEYINNTDTSYGNLMLVNKYLKLDSSYVPADLEKISDECFINGNTLVRQMTKEAKEAFESLCKDSIKNGTPVYGQSAYRSYEGQEKLYNSAVNTGGKSYADNDTARPGHSEHQTGITIDVSSTKSGNMLSFEKTSSYTWMLENAYKYGFILRYEKGKENIHGYVNEPWHYRYVGLTTAKDMHDNYPDLSYEEYYYKYIDKTTSKN